MTQNQLVLKVLQESGSISRLIGLNYRVKNLPENIRQLRKQGYNIKTVTKIDVSGNTYASWVLKPTTEVAPDLTLRVGAKIRITNGFPNEPYETGDEGAVTDLSDYEGDVYADFPTLPTLSNIYVAAREYAVIA